MPTARRVRSLSELRPGDHISFGRRGYYHHALVLRVTTTEIVILSLTNPSAEPGLGILFSSVSKSYEYGKTGARVQEEKMTLAEFTKEVVYVYDYGGKCSPAEVVIRRAEAVARGEIPWDDYHLTNNNCEHFATWCKTGEKYSKQVDVATTIGAVFGALAIGGMMGYLAYKSDDKEKNKEKTRNVYI